MICQSCYEEEAIEGEKICQNCKDAEIDTDDRTLDELIELM